MHFVLRRAVWLLWPIGELPLCAQFSWTVTPLTPAGAGASIVLATNGVGQFGATQNINTGDSYAAAWSGTAGSYVNLSPAGATDSVVWDVSGSQQVGRAIFGFANQRAALWTGSAESYVDLHPSGASSSF